MSDPGAAGCQLCEAERLTEWFHEDEDCWVALCTICTVPMIVWKAHDPAPPPAVKARLHDRLAAVVVEHFTFEHYVDEDMRRIPDHYHAHARPIYKGVRGFFGGPHLRKRQPNE